MEASVGFPSAVHHSLALPRLRAGALSLQVWRGSAAGTADALLREGLLLEHAAALGALAQLAIPAGLVIPLPGLRGGLGDFALADSSVGALAAQGGDPFLERATM